MREKGFVLPAIIITTVFLSALAVIITDLAVKNFRLASQDTYRLNAQLAADAGIDYAIVELNNDNDWAGTAGEVELLNDGKIRTTYEVGITTNAIDDKTVLATGRTYRPPSATTPENERSYEVDMRGIGVTSGSGSFSLVTGVGGLFMENSAKIVDGEVFVNGEINMSNTSQIGLTSQPVLVKAAHQNCPAGGGAGYPTVCTSGEPISISSPAHIYGDVCAKNQTDGSNMSNGGLDTGCTEPAPQALPAHDRAAQKSAATNNMTAAVASCNSNSGTRNILANTHITGGDVLWQKKCDITVNGDVWIDGSLELRNTAEIIVSESAGTTEPVIMIDDANGVEFHNSTTITPNSQGTGVEIITYHSTASCSPDCANVTGQDLYDSRGISTIYLEQSSSAPSSILYARWTRAQLNNGGDIGAIVGQTVLLQNSASVTFGASVGSGGGGVSSTGTWLVDGYRRVF